MKNWPKRRRTSGDVIQLWISKKMIRFASRLPEAKHGAISFLQETGEDKFAKYFGIEKPKDVEYVPFAVAYYDLIPAEEFVALEDGLIRLRSRYSGRICDSKQAANVRDFFTTLRGATGGGSWMNAGLFKFQTDKKGPLLLESAHIHVRQLSPSYLSLQLFVFPTKEFIATFTRLISRNIINTTLIHLGHFVRGRMVSSGLLPSAIRQEEIEHLYLQLNRELVTILRRHMKAGWMAQGPLPSIELFYTNTDLRKGIRREEYEFWRSLSLNALTDFIYSVGASMYVVPPEWGDKPRLTESHKLLIDPIAYKAEHHSTEDPDNFDYALAHHLDTSLLPEMMEHLSFTRLTSILSQRIATLRAALPIGPCRGGPLSSLRRWLRRFFLGPLWINSMEFEHKRAKMELLDGYLANKDGTSLKRTCRSATGPKGFDFGEDSRHSVKYFSEYVDSQLELLRSSLKDLWDFHLQCLLLAITIIGLLLTVVQTLPDSTKTRLWSSLKHMTQTEKKMNSKPAPSP